MHDESPGGIACKDRTLAYWTDPNNFRQNTSGSESNAERKVRKVRQFGFGYIAGLVASGFFS